MSELQTRSEQTDAIVRPTRILVVDDDGLQLRATMRRFRDRKDLAVTAVDNAIDAMLQIGLVKPDLVVMDVFMPGLDGIEACRRIKTNPTTQHIEVVLASAAMTPDLEIAAREAGAKRAVSKPIDLNPMLGRVPRASTPPPFEQQAEMGRGSDVLVQMLAEAGVDVVFGLPGGAISPVHDALMDSKIRVVTTRHEAGAMFAAAGYAHATGKLGVVAVTSGPGALNAMTGLASAHCDGLPLMLLVGEVPRAAHGKGVLQDGSAFGLQIVEMARYVSKLAAEVPRGSALPHLVRRSIATAMSGRRGPVVLTLPVDVMTAKVGRPRAGGTVTMGGIVDAATLDEVTDLLIAAQRPLIVAGSGVRGSGAPARLRAVAERLGVPVVTTPKAKGVFAEDHPLSLGVIGMGGHPSARAYLETQPDVVLAIGTSLGDISTDGFTPLLQASRALIHVDIDARQHGKSYTPTHAVVASASEFLGGVHDLLGDRSNLPTRAAPGGVKRHEIESSKKPHRIASHDAVREVQAILPKDAIFTVDSGEHFVFATHYLEITKPDSYLVMTGLGSMGQSIGAAIGAKLAHPKRAVAAICGDGCFAMNAFEVATAVQERIPIVVFVFNDERLGMVENGHENVYGRRPEYPTNPLDVCAVARGLGATTMRVDGVGQLADCKELIANATGPVVVEVRIDHEIVVPKLDRIAAMTLPPSVAHKRSTRIPKIVN